MNAYRITLPVFEKGEYEDGKHKEHADTTVEIITVAGTMADASAFAKSSYEKADGTDIKEFYWEATQAERIRGIVALPTMKAIAPRT